MKINKLLLILLTSSIMISCSKTKKKEYNDTRPRVEFYKQLEAGNCVRDEFDVKAKYPWQKDFTHKGLIYVVISKDPNNKAYFIAQPEPHCDQPSHKSHLCDYRFRTVESTMLYMFEGHEKIIECPKELTLDLLREKLNNSNYYRGKVSF